VPDERATFTVGELTNTGLPDGVADAIVCADALFFALDRIAALAEVARVLRPGGRWVFTADESGDATRPSAVPDWAPLIRAGGLTVVSREEIPGWAEQLQRMYDNWVANEDRLRASLDEASVADLLGEAAAVGPTLARRTGVVYTAARP
jgi:ubiquinone/menaquinone biosynthesis C-methylase UbiE